MYCPEVYHSAHRHIREQAEFLKHLRFFPVKGVVVKLVEQDDFARNGIQILLDKDERIPQDNFIDSLQLYEVCIVDSYSKLAGEALRVPGAICADIVPGFFNYLCVVHDRHDVAPPLRFVSGNPFGVIISQTYVLHNI